MNLICLYYICRESGNRKQYSSIVFDNRQNRTEAEVDKIIRQHLLDDMWFSPAQWNIPSLFTEYAENELAPRYHEYVGVQKVEETFQRNIESLEILLEKVRQSSY